MGDGRRAPGMLSGAPAAGAPASPRAGHSDCAPSRASRAPGVSRVSGLPLGEPVVELRDVTCTTAGGMRILDGVSLTVRRGECVLLAGRSGSGKTTVTKCVNGLIPQFEPGIALAGSVRVCGHEPARSEMYELARHVGSVFQNPKSQFFNLTSTDELAFGLETAGAPVEVIEERVRRTVAALHAERLLGRNVQQMSGGEKQSLVFASVDVADPDVYVLDEPTANLDASAVRALHDQVAAILRAGKTVLIAEHRLYFAADLIDRAVLVDGGRIAGELSPEELAALDSSERARLGLRAVDADEALAVGVLLVDAGGERDGTASAAVAVPTEKPARGLDLAGYTVLRRGVPAFEPVSFSVEPGEVVGVLGENGTGKSTLLRGIAGLERHDRGTVAFDGASRSRKERRRIASLVMQDVNHQLFGDSVRSECLLSLGSREEGEARARMDAVLASLDLDGYADVHPMALSGGQKQRLAVACALLADRRLLLLDEPTSGLDFEHMVEVGGLVRDVAARGIAVVLVTHDREFLNRCCDKALELRGMRYHAGGKGR